MAIIYRGKRCEHGVDVSVMGIDLRQRKRARPLRHIPFHSPDGCTWGDHGSGPADLALAILVDYLRERPPRTGWLAGEQFSRWTVNSKAFTLHQDCKREVVAQYGDDWELDGMQIDTWLKDHPQTAHRVAGFGYTLGPFCCLIAGASLRPRRLLPGCQ